LIAYAAKVVSLDREVIAIISGVAGFQLKKEEKSGDKVSKGGEA